MSLIEGRLFLLVFCGFMAIMTWINIRRANSGSLNPVIRPINGLDAIEEAVGRATEMGRPVHYSIGIAGVTDQSAPQTIAGLEILGFTTSLVAKYNARIVATTPTAQVFPIAQEIMRQKFLAAGKPEMFLEETVQFLSSDQFAYSAGAMGFMTREKAAANIMMGAFWAESLLMAEAGAHAGAIQVAGTANLHQIPFFVAACDYTLIGEELFTGGAYLSQDKVKLGSVVAQDIVKLVCVALIAVGALLITIDIDVLKEMMFK